ncbi:glycosyltransferase family 2 protein [Thalassovita mediterranea]|nr:glycosyltransferase family 2 protein [Thalassovita mediterranea]
MKVSTLILTLNEEANLPACLGALAWCDDIVVVDSGSTDGTVAIAEAHGARVLSRPFDSFSAQRNWGVENAGFVHDWVLHLDADEVLTPDFVQALDATEAPAKIDAYQVPSKTMFFGKWLRWAGMWPSYQVRLGRRDGLRFVQVGHGQREDLPGDRVGVFPEAYLHYSFSHGLTHWLRRHLRYAEQEVEQLHRSNRGSGDEPGRSGGVTSGRRRLKALAARAPLTLRPFLKFCYVYFWRLGFLDGKRGFAYAFMLAVYEGMIAVIGIDRLEKIAPTRTNVARTITKPDS